MVEIRWSPAAAADFESIITYYDKTTPKFAQNLAKKILYIIENITLFPKMGRKVPDSDNPNVREIIYRNFRIIYRLKTEFLEIVRIIHGSRILKL
ncbi:MAG: type II toxin-antitoxin system RelE/ParE family toxin [Candidatus Lokiarchaeota archaeon]|nr:type II toxin-antitoxin system RelE/ParE family toxin [Candidatus Lokiarchaeota archaeon]MBD3198974.1 type II toxin-antitoxin system RelE/ParE family toxin [Candidatus Lokiarchaeota archaeon]